MSVNDKQDNREHVVILGAGPAGLATGHEVSTHNSHKVTVLERNNFVGGLCNTIVYKGYKFDLGGHRWFTKNEHLNRWFQRLMEGEYIWVERISRIFYDYKYYSYPVSFGNVIKNSGIFTIGWAGITYLLSALQFSVFNKPIRNMRDAYVAQFGIKLYDMFFRRYSEKVWGLPCEELSADWVSQRSAGLSIWTVIQEALLNTKTDKKSLIEEFMYPRDGYVRIPQRMAEDIENSYADNSVRLESNVTAIKYNGPNDFEVTYKTQDGAEHTEYAKSVVSTIPLGVLPRLIDPPPKPEVIEAASSLIFRDIICVNLIVNKQQVSIDTWLYVQDEDVIFGRLHEPKNWSKAMVPNEETTSLVLECFCTRGDNIWEMSDDDIARQCVKDLENKLGLVKPGEVVDWKVVRALQAYPVYDLDYAPKIELVKEYLNQFEGLYIVGRGGTHRYNNADHSIEMGLLLGRHLLGYEVDYLAVNTEPDYQEIVSGGEPKRDAYRDEACQSE
ncbi:MAG: FAD-dependent oxidoreductase [Alcanivorax sp.]|jgi:protoporphyrinogen oxidase|nr:MAG: FAD-dependent oxidoreductase [Alcanivorax sp.]|tara:strand:- start:6403 stop:7902 length:1500 start_codon:yes stop_codon:yes gene_type:complete